MRKRRTFAGLLLLAGCLIFTTGAFAQPKISEGSKKIAQFKYKDITWQIPEVGKQVDTLTLPNGIKLFLLEDHAIPIFSMNALVRTGNIYEPADQMGLAGLTGTVMRTGGTETLDPDSLNRLLEFIAGSVETGIGTESGVANLNVLSKDMNLGIEIFADVLMHPAFRQEKIDLAKDQIRESIRRRNDSPGQIVSREFNHLIYGAHPYGRVLEWETVKKLTRDDLIAFHRKYYKPNNILLGVAGDFKKAEVVAKLKQVFADWKPEPVDFPPLPKVADQPNPGVYVIAKEINQTNVTMGHLGCDFNNPDIYAISVMNFILGGGSFTSRMTSRVRSDEGLAYSVGSSFNTGSRDLGTFSATCQTKTETTHKAISLMLEEIKKIREAPVTADELKTAKDSFINRYVFQFTNPGAIVGQLMGLEYFNRPRDFLKTYLDKIRAVTAADVQRAAQKYLKPENLTLVVVGKTDKFDKNLDDLGQVKPIALQPPAVD